MSFSLFQLPENVNISKEARTAIGKAASVFVLYATSWCVISLSYSKFFFEGIEKKVEGLRALQISSCG